MYRSRDPLVTSGEGLPRFESFSAFCSTCASLDQEPDSYRAVPLDHRTAKVLHLSFFHGLGLVLFGVFAYLEYFAGSFYGRVE